jgi:hypothetical protein
MMLVKYSMKLEQYSARLSCRAASSTRQGAKHVSLVQEPRTGCTADQGVHGVGTCDIKGKIGTLFFLDGSCSSPYFTRSPTTAEV